MSATLTSAIGYRGKPTVTYVREGDNQTYAWGDPVGLTTNKAVNLVAADTDWDTNSGVKMIGAAKRPARNSVSPGQVSGQPEQRDVPIEIVDGQYYLKLPFWAAGGAAASAYNQFEIGSSCCLRYVSASKTWVANIGNTANPTLELVAKIPNIPDAQSYYWGFFKVVSTMRALG